MDDDLLLRSHSRSVDETMRARAPRKTRQRAGRRRSSAGPRSADASIRPDLLAEENLPTEPCQQRSLEKRARLKAAALGLFGEHGYENTSIEDIARRANLASGGFYLHFRSKRQLLIVLMDDLVDVLSRLELRLGSSNDVRTELRALLARAFANDLQYLGAVRAWQEAVLTDPDLAKKHRLIHSWTNTRVTSLFTRLLEMPGARPRVDAPGLARAVDTLFWALLGQALLLSKVEIDDWLDSATHLIYHALFEDAKTGKGGKR